MTRWYLPKFHYKFSAQIWQISSRSARDHGIGQGKKAVLEDAVPSRQCAKRAEK